ncbi:MAG: EFR1 family ferrodoxin [Synergistaceae bacterium]|nr:EFR1 family ferrodoxin [Synergistaceae bacterium]
MRSGSAAIAVFTGTGNTLLAAGMLAEALRSLGRSAVLCPMEHGVLSLPKERALGIAAPVACFSTYPAVWRFIDSLPPGNGREVFLLATMGGAGCGMEGPIRASVAGKGYEPIGSLIVTMPGNYGKTKIDERNNRTLIDGAAEKIKKYAESLTGGSAVWGRGVPGVSRFFASLAHGRKPWDTFYRFFPLTVDRESCTGCSVCRELCPEGNITMEKGRAAIGRRCQSCQRCSAFCPAGAVKVPGRNYVPYREVELESILRLTKAGE